MVYKIKTIKEQIFAPKYFRNSRDYLTVNIDKGVMLEVSFYMDTNLLIQNSYRRFGIEKQELKEDIRVNSKDQ